MINISDISNPMILLNEKLLKIIVDKDLIYTMIYINFTKQIK